MIGSEQAAIEDFENLSVGPILTIPGTSPDKIRPLVVVGRQASLAGVKDELIHLRQVIDFNSEAESLTRGVANR